MAENKFAKAIAEAAEHNDYNEATAGGDFPILPEGPVRLRFVGYIELGQEDGEWQGKKKVNDKARFVFEVTGPKIEPREDGKPQTMAFDLNKSLSEKSGFYKLFRKLNHEGKARVFAELLGDAYRGLIRHEKGKKDESKTYATLRDADGNIQIAPPYYDDPESGERRVLAVPEPLSPLQCFLWDYADREMWDSIFIDGEWEAKDGQPAKSKNWIQNRIKAAKNWVGSPMQEQLLGDIDVGDAERVSRSDADREKVNDAKAGASASEDPLDDIPF